MPARLIETFISDGCAGSRKARTDSPNQIELIENRMAQPWAVHRDKVTKRLANAGYGVGRMGNAWVYSPIAILRASRIPE